MTFPRYFETKLTRLLEVFEMIEAVFMQNQPIDRFLQHYFRKNKQFGSKDRKLVSSSIFSYFRWFGWVAALKTENSKKLLIAYLLDQNEKDEFTAFWGSKIGISEFPEFVDISSKLEWILQFNESASLIDLFPTDIPSQVLPYIEDMQKRAPLWIRIVPGKEGYVSQDLKNKGVRFEVHSRSVSSFKIEGNPVLTGFKSYKEGLFEVQDIASQGIGMICDPLDNETWWDVCAGAGGKSLQLSNQLSRGLVLATDIRENALSELVKRSSRLNAGNLTTLVWNGVHLDDTDSLFDGVLIDAPCSCSGTWRRSPWTRWQKITRDRSEVRDVQSRLLLESASKVKAGGVLIYATCSLFPDENEDQVRSFLKENPDFYLEPFSHPFIDGEVEGWIYFTPDVADGDIMFAAKIRRKE